MWKKLTRKLGAKGMGKRRKQKQTHQCQKLFQDAFFWLYTDKLTPRS